MTFTPIGMKSRREALGLSQGWLGKALGVHQVQVARWESGERTPVRPEEITGLLKRLETAMINLEDSIYEDGEEQGRGDRSALIVVPHTDERFHAVDESAAEAGLPASFYRIAAARAAVALRDELDITARIETA